MWTPLYVKSNYTFLSSLVNIDKLIKKCQDMNIKQVALCDDNMIATMYFYKECKKEGIKPIIGCEVYVAPRSRFNKESGIDDDIAHLILLVKNT